jgi:hypothetical protein
LEFGSFDLQGLLLGLVRSPPTVTASIDLDPPHILLRFILPRRSRIQDHASSDPPRRLIDLTLTEGANNPAGRTGGCCQCARRTRACITAYGAARWN